MEEDIGKCDKCGEPATCVSAAGYECKECRDKRREEENIMFLDSSAGRARGC
jgi:hypothetical protein